MKVGRVRVAVLVGAIKHTATYYYTSNYGRHMQLCLNMTDWLASSSRQPENWVFLFYYFLSCWRIRLSLLNFLSVSLIYEAPCRHTNSCVTSSHFTYRRNALKQFNPLPWAAGNLNADMKNLKRHTHTGWKEWEVPLRETNQIRRIFAFLDVCKALTKTRKSKRRRKRKKSLKEIERMRMRERERVGLINIGLELLSASVPVAWWREREGETDGQKRGAAPPPPSLSLTK